MKKMPVLFVGHGSPMNIIEKNSFTKKWQEIALKVPYPKAILCLSAHWYGQGQKVSLTEKPETIYDFYGFPSELYAIAYRAPGAPALGRSIMKKLGAAVKPDTKRGLDHGVWSVLCSMYPKADIPICQLSLDSNMTPKQVYEAGKALASFRHRNILIIGSGNVVHNLQKINWNMDGGFDWAEEFDAYIKKAILKGEHNKVVDYEKAGPCAKKAFTYRDHFDPLLYILGMTDHLDNITVFNEKCVKGSLSMTSYLFEKKEMGKARITTEKLKFRAQDH